MLGTRSLPDLGLGRLRAAGQLLERATEQLRFTLPEAQQFFALRHRPRAGSTEPPMHLDAAAEMASHLPHLWAKTVGWIAARWLASMALNAVIARQGLVADFIEKFSGKRWKHDFHVGYSPERINPGDKEHTLTKILKVVSGDDQKTLGDRKSVV